MERHHATGRVGLGFTRGFGLKRGAIASTVCHDAHNLIVIGENDLDMYVAAKALKECGGGFAAACAGKVIGILPLPVAGLMSTDSAAKVANTYDDLNNKAREQGSLVEDPFLALSFLSLSVVPSLRILDRGILDVNEGRFVSLFE